MLAAALPNRNCQLQQFQHFNRERRNKISLLSWFFFQYFPIHLNIVPRSLLAIYLFHCSADYFKSVLIQDGGTRGTLDYKGNLWLVQDICEALSFHGKTVVFNFNNKEPPAWFLIVSFFVSSVGNLLRSGAISKPPLWFGVVKAFPPLRETKLNRIGDEELMHKIIYPEDEFRK